MITAIREVRRARKMTLDGVARACDPPTTAQTIGRLETGTRTVSVGWLNRIAKALGVTASDLVKLPQRPDLPVAAILSAEGVYAPRKPAIVIAPQPAPALIAILVESGIGDYRAGDEIWCERLGADQSGMALNRDVLIPRPAGRFLFGRMIGREEDRIQLLPLGTGGRQQIITNPPWIAVAVRLVRAL